MSNRSAPGRRTWLALFSFVFFLATLFSETSAAIDAPKTEALPPEAQLICGEQVEMGTKFKICVYVEPADQMNVRFDMQKAFRKLRQMNDWMSEWQPHTDLSQVNASSGARPVKVRSELFELLQYSLGVSEKTDGAFDPTFNAFWGLYSFKPNDQREPTDAQIKERLPLVNWRNVELDSEKQTVFLKRPGMKLGFGAIGQSYGVDVVVADLKRNYKAGYVDGSGDTYFWGVKPNGEKWLTGVRDPRNPSAQVARIYGTDFAITTSGDDENFFMVGKRRVHHILDPKTGRPATGARQVTVIAKRALDADAYDTAGVVLGPEKTKALLEKLGMQGVIITDQSVVMTSGLKKQATQWGEVYVVE